MTQKQINSIIQKLSNLDSVSLKLARSWATVFVISEDDMKDIISDIESLHEESE